MSVEHSTVWSSERIRQFSPTWSWWALLLAKLSDSTSTVIALLLFPSIGEQNPIAASVHLTFGLVPGALTMTVTAVILVTAFAHIATTVQNRAAAWIGIDWPVTTTFWYGGAAIGYLGFAIWNLSQITFAAS